jgi:hypothetical protein
MVLTSEKDDAGQPRRIDKYRPMLFKQASPQWRNAPAQRANTAPVFWLGAAALRDVWKQLGPH